MRWLLNGLQKGKWSFILPEQNSSFTRVHTDWVNVFLVGNLAECESCFWCCYQGGSAAPEADEEEEEEEAKKLRHLVNIIGLGLEHNWIKIMTLNTLELGYYSVHSSPVIIR